MCIRDSFSGDVDTVEALFTSGIISMAADACRIISIMAVIAVKNTGIALVLLLVLPLFAVFTHHCLLYTSGEPHPLPGSRAGAGAAAAH